MPKIDLTISVTVVIAICAIISPILTTLLNNRHIYKMKKLEMKLDSEKASLFYKRGIYEQYLKAAGTCVSYANQQLINEYGEIYLLALIYFPEELQTELININDHIVNLSWDKARKSLNQFAPKIRTILKNM